MGVLGLVMVEVDRTQVFRLGSKYLHQLSHQTSTQDVFQNDLTSSSAPQNRHVFGLVWF